MKEVSISRGGQISVPAAVRNRWKTSRVLIDDRGDVLVIRPLPEDAIAAARGSLRPRLAGKMTSEAARRQMRSEEAAGKGRRP